MILKRNNVEKTVDTEEAAVKLIAEGFRALHVSAGSTAKEETAEAQDRFITGSAGFKDSAEVPVQEKNLRAMKVQDLRNLAKARGISGTGAMTKAELVELLEE